MKRLAFGTDAEYAAAVPVVVRHLRAGGLIGYPTETVYGLGCTLMERPLARLAALKQREKRPFLLLAPNEDRLPRLRWTAAAARLAGSFWPGPLTLVLAADETLPPEIVAADGTVAVRVSPHPGVRALLAELDAPITSTSANPPGATPAASAAETEAAIAALGDVADWIVLDGGTLLPSPPSTIVRCVDEDVTVIRAGAIGLESLHAFLEETHGRT